MRQMSLGIYVFGKPSFDKKLEIKENKKIGELSTEVIQESTDNGIPVTTKKP